MNKIKFLNVKNLLILVLILFLNMFLNAQEEKGSCLEGDCKNGFSRFGNENHFIEGIFKNGKLDRSKSIREVFDDGSEYEGFLNKEAEKEGHGKFSYIGEGSSNHCIYEGNFKADIFHGKGKLTCEDGTFYEGNWSQGKRDYTVTVDLIARSIKRPDKWRDAKISGSFYFKQFREQSEVAEKLKDIDYEIDWAEFSVAEVLFDTQEILGTRFWLLIPKSLETKFDKLASKEKPIVSVEGVAVGVSEIDYGKVPIIKIDKIR